MIALRSSHSWSVTRLRRFLALALLASVLCGRSAGQELPIQSYTIREGLPSNTIKALLQDSRGYIWVGTTNGLARYDGYRFTVYTTINGLSDNYITCLVESRSEPGVIWIGTVSGGLCRYAAGAFAVVDSGSNAFDRSIADLLADREGRIWYGTQNGLKIVERGAVRWVRTTDGTVGPNILLAESHDGTIYVTMHDTLYRMAGEMPVPAPFPGGTKRAVSAIAADSANNLWLMRQDSLLVRYTGNAVTYEKKLPFDPGPSMTDDGRGNLWLSLHRGIAKLELAHPERISSYDRRDGLPEAILGPLLVDWEKTLWVGSIADGLKKLSHFNYRTLSTSAPGRYARNIWGVFDRQDRCWIGTAGQFLEVYPTTDEKVGIIPHRMKNAGQSEEILPLGLDGTNTLLVTRADRKVLYRYQVTNRPGEPSFLRDLPPIPVASLAGGTILNACATRGGDILIGIADAGVAVFAKDALRPGQSLSPADGLPGTSILVLFEDAGGDVWVGDFTGGLARLHKEQGRWKVVRSFTVKDGLPDSHIRSIAQDERGRLWIGTRYGGVACMDGGTFRTVARKDGLHGDKIWDIAPAGDVVWVGTDYGLERIDGKTFTVVPERPLLTGSNVFRCGLTRKGEVWALTSYSLDIYDYKREEMNRIPPPVEITGFTVNGKRRDTSAPGDLRSDEDDCIIDFVGLSYRDDGVSRYEYMLEGMDKTWHTTSQRAVTMAGLSPREYSFVVRALNSDGLASAKPATLRFRILPPFWQRWWFLLLGLCAVAAAVAFGVRRHFQTLERDRLVQHEFSRRLIESQENERKRIASELHDSIGQNLLIIKNHAMFGLQCTDAGSPAADHLREITSLSGDTIDQAREISYNLRPYQIDRIGLTKALQSIVTRISRATTMTISGKIENVDDLFPKEQEIIIYRIIQEAMNNIVKHSGASASSLAVMNHGGAVEVVIADAGKGFSVPMIHHGQLEGSGLGLQSIHERVRILGGSLAIESSPDRGTTLTIVLPIEGALA